MSEHARVLIMLARQAVQPLAGPSSSFSPPPGHVESQWPPRRCAATAATCSLLQAEQAPAYTACRPKRRPHRVRWTGTRVRQDNRFAAHHLPEQALSFATFHATCGPLQATARALDRRVGAERDAIRAAAEAAQARSRWPASRLPGFCLCVSCHRNLNVHIADEIMFITVYQTHCV